MTSPIRPIFQEQERLTARRLNAAVEYLRSTLRRVLLAPLSPGVATGLELAQAPDGSRITVSPGIAIDGRGRLLVLTDALAFGIVDVQKQIPDLGVGESFSIHLALDDRYASYDPCAAQLPLEVIERVKLVFRKAPPAETSFQILPIAGLIGLLHSLAPALSQPWDELDPAGRPSDDFRVRLGQAKWNGESGVDPGFRETSMASRTGVVPRFAGLRNSFGEMSMVLGRNAAGKAIIGVSVPTTFGVGAAVIHQAPVDFQTDLVVKGAADFENAVTFNGPAGGKQVQAAVVAKDLGEAPAGRVSPSDSRVFEVAGGREGAPVGAGGALAVSMQYIGSGLFPTVEHAGFPLSLAFTGTATILVPCDGTTFPVGVSAGKSTVHNGIPFVPLAATGLVVGRVKHTSGGVLPIGTELTAVAIANADPPAEYPLKQASSGNVVVARAALPVAVSSGVQELPIWITPPYLK